MTTTSTNPRLQQVIEHWELKNSYESLVVSLDICKNVFCVIPGDLPGNSSDIDDIPQEEVPIASVLGFLNIFFNGKFTTGIDGSNLQPSVFFNHRKVIGMDVFVPQDSYIIYLEDEVVKGDFGEEHSRLLQTLLKIA